MPGLFKALGYIYLKIYCQLPTINLWSLENVSKEGIEEYVNSELFYIKVVYPVLIKLRKKNHFTENIGSHHLRNYVSNDYIYMIINKLVSTIKLDVFKLLQTSKTF